MSDFWAELEEDVKNVDIEAELEELNSGPCCPPIKDYYCRIKDWEFNKSSKKGTPGIFTKAELLAPCDGIDMKKTEGKTVKVNLWLSPKAIARAIGTASILCGKKLTSASELQTAKLDTNIFKLVSNSKNEDGYFNAGYINAMSSKDYDHLADIAPGKGVDNGSDVDDTEEEF